MAGNTPAAGFGATSGRQMEFRVQASASGQRQQHVQAEIFHLALDEPGHARLRDAKLTSHLS